MARTFSSGTNYISGTTPVTTLPFTMAGWVYIPTLSTAQSLSALGGTTFDHTFWLEMNASNQLRAVARSTAGVAAITSNTFSANTWHHVAGVYVSDTSRFALLDGPTGKGTDTASATVNAPANVYIGRRAESGSPMLSGRGAEFAVWDAALTDPEIAALARGASPLLMRPANLVGYWPIWGKDSPEPDLSGGARNLTVSGTPPYADHAPVALRLHPTFLAADVGAAVYTQTKFRVYLDNGSGAI